MIGFLRELMRQKYFHVKWVHWCQRVPGTSNLHKAIFVRRTCHYRGCWCHLRYDRMKIFQQLVKENISHNAARVVTLMNLGAVYFESNWTYFFLMLSNQNVIHIQLCSRGTGISLNTFIPHICAENNRNQARFLN